MQRFATTLAVIGAILFAAAAQAAAQPGAPLAQPLAESHWRGPRDASFSDAGPVTLYFRSDGALVYNIDGAANEVGRWRQRGLLVTFETENLDTVSVGLVRGDAIEGVTYDSSGRQAAWRLTRLSPDQIEPSLCPQNLVALRGAATPLVCICPASIELATVWGDEDAYTDDSHICTAAVHAGAVSAQWGGLITVTPTPGRDAYPASTAHGVTTLAYGSWMASYTVSGEGGGRRTK